MNFSGQKCFGCWWWFFILAIEKIDVDVLQNEHHYTLIRNNKLNVQMVWSKLMSIGLETVGYFTHFGKSKRMKGKHATKQTFLCSIRHRRSLRQQHSCWHSFSKLRRWDTYSNYIAPKDSNVHTANGKLLKSFTHSSAGTVVSSSTKCSTMSLSYKTTMRPNQRFAFGKIMYCCKTTL